MWQTGVNQGPPSPEVMPDTEAINEPGGLITKVADRKSQL